MLDLIEVMMTRIQFILILAGFFQIISQGMDQYVIQKEQVIRNLENNISKQEYILSENISTNRSYYETYSRIVMDTDLKLKLINNKITDQKLKNYLLKNKDIILRQFKLILSNPYIDIKDPNIYLKPFDEIDLILNNQDEIKSYQTKLSINFGDTGLILNDLLDSNEKISNIIQNLEIELHKVVTKKFKFLIYGLVSNILSILFILIFFYYLYRSKKFA
tara:strand:+ start:1021 stop:1677 length:657 start_codon:yes stop_codon:yes gene_type:complete